MTNPFDLSGKVAAVTGANNGIGEAIAVALAEAGAEVALVGRSSADETADLVRRTGRRALLVDADLSTIAPVQEVVDRTLSELGALDILVNNAGIIRRADSVDFSEADWDAVVDTNLKTIFFLCQAAGRHMIARGRGKIINIASTLSFQGGVRVPSYTASKSGVAGLTRLLANERAAKGVNVNANRAGLHRHQQHRRAAGGRKSEPPDPRAHPRRPLGRPLRPRRSRGLPRLGRIGLCPRPHPCRRRRLTRAVRAE